MGGILVPQAGIKPTSLTLEGQVQPLDVQGSPVLGFLKHWKSAVISSVRTLDVGRSSVSGAHESQRLAENGHAVGKVHFIMKYPGARPAGGGSGRRT